MRGNLAAALLLMVLALAARAQAQRVIVNGRIVNRNQPARSPAPSLPAPTEDLIRFLDGSQLHGKLEAIEPGRKIRWFSSDAGKEVQFSMENLDRIRFAQPKPMSSKPQCRIKLANEDEISGGIAAMDWERLRIDTWFAGAVSVARSNVQSIVFLPKDFSVVFEGPVNGVGWAATPQDAWDFRDGVFVSRGSGLLTTDAQLAGSTTIEFSLAWASRFAMMIGLYVEKDQFSPGDPAFYISLSNDRASVQRVGQGSGPADLGSAIFAAPRKNRMRVAIQCNQEEKTMTLFVDEQRVHQWKCEAGFVRQGSRALFSDQTGAPGLELSEVRVSRWSGPEPDLASLGQTNADCVSLLNHDKAPGKIVNIAGTNLEFELSGRTLRIPLERLTRIDFATPPGGSRQAVGNVRARLPGGTWISMDMENWSPALVSGHNAFFGALAVQTAMIRELQFNPRQPRGETVPAAADEYGGLDD